MNCINTAGLLPPQFAHTKRLIDSLYLNGYAIDTSETGTGKTYVAAAIIREMNRPAFIVCPKPVIPQWEKVLAKFDLKATIVNYEKLGRGNTRWMVWRKLQNMMRPWDEMMPKEDRPLFQIPKESLIILDEGHKCKGEKTTNCEMMISLGDQGYKVLTSSATIATTPLEMRAVGFLTQLHKLYNFDKFKIVHGAKWLGRWGAMTFDMASAESKKGMMLLHEYLYKTKKCASRLVVEDFGDLFPESHIVAEAYDLGSMESKVQAVYDEMEAEIAKLDERCASYSEHIFAIMMEARRRAELCKVPLFVEMIEDLYDEGKSVVCFINFQETEAAITKRLNKSKKLEGQVGYIIGGQNEKVRQQDIADFNSDTKRILIANIKAGGIGINLHDLNGKFPRASIISPNYSAYELVQALGRVWRQGGLTKSYQRIVFAAKTIEEQACWRVQFRLNNLSTLNDADMRAGIKLFG